jgi:hypothetical protein
MELVTIPAAARSARAHAVISAQAAGSREPRGPLVKCELAHNRLRFSVAQSKSRRVQAMIQQPAKRIPQWLTIDALIILVSLSIIGIGVWIAP